MMEPPVRIDAEITDGRNTKLFLVQNTALNRSHIIAVDSLVAAAVAREAGGVRSVFNALTRPVNMEDLAKSDPKYAASIDQALKSRLQGIVNRVSGSVVVRGRVFSPGGEVL